METLDSLVSDRPAIFHRRCLHVMALNSAAISALGLDSSDFVPPENIEIVRLEIFQESQTQMDSEMQMEKLRVFCGKDLILYPISA